MIILNRMRHGRAIENEEQLAIRSKGGSVCFKIGR
jgi:hypothetical protein